MCQCTRWKNGPRARSLRAARLELAQHAPAARGRPLQPPGTGGATSSPASPPAVPKRRAFGAQQAEVEAGFEELRRVEGWVG